MTDEIEGNDVIVRITTLVGSAVNRIGIAKIALIVIIAVAAWWFLSLPQPGNLTIRVTALDEGNGVQDAIVVLSTPDGRGIGAEFTAITDSSGVARFSNVPSQELAVQVNVPGFETSYEIFTLGSGESRSEDVKMAREVSLSLSPASTTVTASEACVKRVNIAVTNEGDGEVEISLVGNTPLASAVTSQTTTVFPGATSNVTAIIDFSKSSLKKGASATSALRIKGTNKKATLNLRIEENPRVDVSPQGVNCAAERQCQQIITITNRGQATLENLAVQPSESVVPVLEGGDVERFYTSTSIAPGAEAKFAVRINAVEPTIGVITVKGDCFERQIDVKTG